MYKVTVSPDPGVSVTYDINTESRLVANVQAQTMAMRDFKKGYGEVRLIGIVKAVPAATETTFKEVKPIIEAKSIVLQKAGA